MSKSLNGCTMMLIVESPAVHYWKEGENLVSKILYVLIPPPCLSDEVKQQYKVGEWTLSCCSYILKDICSIPALENYYDFIPTDSNRCLSVCTHPSIAAAFRSTSAADVRAQHRGTSSGLQSQDDPHRLGCYATLLNVSRKNYHS